MGIYERIRHLCKEKGTTVNRMEIDLGIKGSVNRWNVHAPSAERAQMVADYLGVSIAYLLTGEEKEPAEKRAVTEEEIKYAFFGGDADLITEEDMADIRKVADIIVQRKKRGSKD